MRVEYNRGASIERWASIRFLTARFQQFDGFKLTKARVSERYKLENFTVTDRAPLLSDEINRIKYRMGSAARIKFNKKTTQFNKHSPPLSFKRAMTFL